MTVDSPEKHPYGALRTRIVSHRTPLLTRAGACVVLAGLFLWVWFTSSGELGSGIRFWMPLVVPVAAVLGAAAMALSTLNRLDVYERGLVYHTAFYELTADWDTVTDLTLVVDHKSGKRGIPMLVLNIAFASERPWSFRSASYSDLETAGAALAQRFAAEHASPDALAD